MKQTIGILGGKGMLGADLARLLGGGDAYETHAIDKDTYEKYRGRKFDIFVNANGNSRRFWANEHPLEDFEASTVSVYKSIADFPCGLYIYMSSSDVYADHSGPATTKEDQPVAFEKLEPYGFHKALSEMIVRARTPEWLILRSSLMLGTNLKKGPFYDIMNRVPLFITAESRLQAISTSEVAHVIRTLIESGARNEAYNMGGTGTFAFQELQGKVVFRPDGAKQVYEMNVEKLAVRVALKTSVEYAHEFLTSHGFEKNAKEQE